jgi:opacity protein-like surface antigen
MKKTILFCAMALATSGLFAQKQTGGEKNLEVQFAPLGGSPVSISGIRLRMFNSEASAIRLSVFVGGSSDATVTAQPGVSGAEDEDRPELYDTEKSFSFSLRPGYEKHFEGTDRLSPYVGGELIFSTTTTKSISESWNETNNGAANPDTYDGALWETTTTDGSTTFGLNVVAGTDFYFADNIYLGAELGFGFSKTNDKDTETEVSDLDLYRASAGIPNETAVEFDPIINGSSSAWGPNFQGTIRLGWLFN